MKKLNLGCGKDYKEGWINHDISNKDIYGNKIKAEIHWDLNKFPWIWKDNTFEEINALAIIEHLESRTKSWSELKRVAKEGCILRVIVPHYSGYTGYDDPTHYHRYSQKTGDMIAEMWGFEILKNKIIYSVKNPLLKIFNPLVNFFPRFYERFLCNIFPSQEIYWEFKIKKKGSNL